MEKIFYPAIHLINRFNYAQKFLLLGLIYLISVSFLVYNLYNHLNSTIHYSKKQLQGINLIQPINQTIQLMQEHNALKLMELSGNTLMQATRQKKQQEINNILQQPNQKWLVDTALNQDWKTIINDWQELKKNQYSMTAEQNFSVHIMLIEKLYQSEIKATDNYSLNSNSDIRLYYLTDTAFNKLPTALEQLGQLRAFGSSILSKKQLTEDEKIKLLTLIAEFNSAFNALKINLQKTDYYNNQLKINLAFTASEIDTAAKQITDLVKTDILTKQFNTLPNDYFNQVTLIIDKGYYQLNKDIFTSIELLLKQRINASKKEMLINIGIASLALLLVFYIFIGIYRTLIHTIKSLAFCAKEFANGNFKERAKSIHHDEFSQIVNHFNDMADSFCSLLEKQQDSEQRLYTIINSALDAVIQMDQQGFITGWNKQAEIIFGWTKEEILGLEVANTIVPERYRESHRTGLKTYLKTGKAMFSHSIIELYGLHHDGHEFPIEISLSPIKTKQGIEFSGFIRDITERKNARTALQESELRFRRLLQDIPTVALQSYDENGVIKFWNQASEQFYGYSADEALGRNIAELLLPVELHEQFNRDMQEIFLTKQLIEPQELISIHKDGRKIDVFCSYAYVHIPNQPPEIFCLDINLTDLKHSEAALREKEQLLEEAQRVARLGYYFIDIKTNFWQSSSVLDEIIGIDKNYVKTMDNWWRLTQPEYIDDILKEFNRSLQEKTNYSVVYKIIRPIDNEVRWILDIGHSETNEQGEIVRFIGTVLDITESKIKEDELQVLFLAAQQSPNSIIITDINANIQFVNKAFSKITGYSSVEALGKNPRILHSGKTPQMTFNDLWSTLMNGEVWQGELFNRRKDGSEYIELAIISPVRQPNGEITHYLAVKEDITEKKRAETELRIAAVAFESQEAILVSDANNLILRVNQAFTQMTGYTLDQVINQDLSILQSDKQDTEFYADMWLIIDETGYWKGEVWNEHKDGFYYAVWMTITAVKNEYSEITHYVVTLTDITERKLAEEKIRQLAFFDPLTELPNRRKLLEHLEFTIASSYRKNTVFAVLMLDLDYFKVVNDSLGHLAGDELLKQVARRISKNVRSSDMVARLGGDEFVVVLENIGCKENITRVANNIIKDISSQFVLMQYYPVHIGTSIGVSLYPEHGNNAILLLDNADKALYQAKNQGRGCYAYFSNDLRHLMQEKSSLESRLNLSISQHELRVFFQPQVDIKTGKIVGAEALVRWQDPEDGFTLPSRFIPIAEQNGLVVAINEWVIKETCKQGRRWLDQGLSPITLSVNISALQMQRGDLNVFIAGILAETLFPAEFLILELTEIILMEHQETAIQQMQELKKLGVRLAIDNFGVGYSSLSYLHRFPLDFMNIDKSFVDELIMPEHNADVVTCIISMGHTLGFKVLAEGVETLEQYQFLKHNGCDLYQGYIKSHALSADIFADLLCDDATP